jgi:hypothetical protein
MFSGTGRAGAYQSLGFGVTTDAVYLPVFAGGTGDLKLTEAWGVRGAFNHNWDPYWSTSIFGSASFVHYNGVVGDLTTAKGQYCAVYAVGKVLSADFTCNPDYAVYMAGVVTRWTPVKNLTFSAEVLWMGLDQNYTGAVSTGGGPGAPKPGGVATAYELKDQNTVSLNVRVQRNF